MYLNILTEAYRKAIRTNDKFGPSYIVVDEKFQDLDYEDQELIIEFATEQLGYKYDEETRALLIGGSQHNQAKVSAVLYGFYAGLIAAKETASKRKQHKAELEAEYGLRSSELTDKLYNLAEKFTKSKDLASIAVTYKELIQLVL